MQSSQKGWWRYSLFQIPAILLIATTAAAIIASFLPIPCPEFWRRLLWGLSMAALAWTVTLPLDRFLQSQTKLTMGLAGRFALGNALFWSALLLALMLSKLPPVWATCTVTVVPDESELVSLDWSRWRANVWNELFPIEQSLLGELGSTADFSFTVFDDHSIEDINVQSDDSALKSSVIERINAIKGNPVLRFIPSTQREEVEYKSSVRLCYDWEEDCGKPANPEDYPDKEEFKQ